MNAKEARELSYIPYVDIVLMIENKARNNETVLPYVLISSQTAQRLRNEGFEVKEGLGGGFGIQKGVSTIKW